MNHRLFACIFAVMQEGAVIAINAQAKKLNLLPLRPHRQHVRIDAVNQVGCKAVCSIDPAEKEKWLVVSAIRLTPMLDAHDFDDFFLLVEFVDDPIGSDSDAPIVL